MRTHRTNEHRFALATLIALPLMLAIALPLYFSGTPTLRAGPSAPAATAIPVNVAAHSLESTAVSEADGADVIPARHLEAGPTTPFAPAGDTTTLAIDALLADRDGVYGVIMTNPGQGTRYSSNADVPFLAASLYKLVLLADVYAAIEDGLIAPDAELALLEEYFPGADEPPDSFFDADSIGSSVLIGDALYATGAYSSNVAAYALLSLTDDAQLQAMARRLGMTHTFFHVQPTDLEPWPPVGLAEASPGALDEAVTFAEQQALDGPLMLTTPRDIEIYFSGLLAGTVVNPTVSARILQILTEQAVDDRFPCLLPFGTEMAHKTGNLDHVVHDVGIIWGLNGPVILIAMAENPPDDAEATLVIQRLAAIAYGTARIPSIGDAFATPEISCGVVAPLATGSPEALTDEEFTDEVLAENDIPRDDLVETETETETDTEPADVDTDGI